MGSVRSGSSAGSGNSSAHAAGGNSTSAPGQLPRTGFDAWLTALGGAGFMLAGFGLRLRLRVPARGA